MEKIKYLIKKTDVLQNIIVLAVTVTFFLGITNFVASADSISDSVLRLHILANSDSDDDQELKLKVRDAILVAGEEAFSGAENAQQAERSIVENSDMLLSVAREVIAKNGYDYDVSLKITDEYFPTRTYGDVTLPAGEYRAVQFIIGEGNGHNWWCVMFPALCLPGASNTALDLVLTDKEREIVYSDPDIDVRFKITEVFEGIRSKAQGLFNT